jgi:hypothetical protein
LELTSTWFTPSSPFLHIAKTTSERYVYVLRLQSLRCVMLLLRVPERQLDNSYMTQ